MIESIIFTPDECNYIKSFWNDDNSIESGGNQLARLGDNIITIKSDCSGHLNYFDKHHELFNFVSTRIKKINVNKISLTIKITKYVEGDYFLPHTDFEHYETGELSRTLVIQLSESSDYIGGDLIIENVKQTRSIGACITIKASQLHEVTKITAGTRYGLVIFLLNEDMGFSKTII